MLNVFKFLGLVLVSIDVNFFKNAMNPTLKLFGDKVSCVSFVPFSMPVQECYDNTTHPDFLNDHKAMAIVQDRLNENKPPPPQADPKTGKLAPGQIDSNKDLDAEFRKEELRFFGSFFANQ